MSLFGIHIAAEPAIRFGCFAGVFLVMTVLELVSPRRPLHVRKSKRWLSNLGLVALNTVVLRLVVPSGAVGFALFVEEHRWGLLQNVGWPNWIMVPAAVILFDLAIYLQHVMFHAVPLLWRLHKVHHADLDFDFTTGLRFHTVEILLSFAIKAATIAVLGTPALAVLIFEVLLNATSMFNHGNVRMPAWIDRGLRWLVVTPDMHRVHHSILVRETNSNYGFNLPWWDRLFGTYRDQPEAGHDNMTIGISEVRDHSAARLPSMLMLPFVAPPVEPPSPSESNELIEAASERR